MSQVKRLMKVKLEEVEKASRLLWRKEFTKGIISRVVFLSFQPNTRYTLC